jgi:hypothetical protein
MASADLESGNKYLTLGNGELWFDPFLPGTTTPSGGEEYIGHSTAFGLGVATTKIEHMGSDRGTKKRNRSVVTSVTRSGSFTTDIISPQNMARALMGSAAVLSVVGATFTDEPHNDVVLGRAYQLGTSANNPAGVVNLDFHTSTTVKVIVKVGSVTKTEGTDYVVDMEQAYVIPLVGGSIAPGDDILVSYKTKTSTRNIVVAANTEVEGTLRYRSYNAEGENMNWFMPYVKLTVDGEIQLKSADAFAEIPFTVEVLERDGLEGLYGNGLAIAA